MLCPYWSCPAGRESLQPNCTALGCGQDSVQFLEYNTLVTHPARDAFAIQVFKQGDGVFSRNARKFFKHRDWELVAALFAIFCEQFLAALRRQLGEKPGRP